MVVRFDPFQTIVNVGWGGFPMVIALFYRASAQEEADGAPPVFDVTLRFEADNRGGEVLSNKLIVARTGVTSLAPPIEMVTTPEMMKHYAIWSYEPFMEFDPVQHSSGGGFYFIQPPDDIGTFPDFVFSPYSSVEAAQAYIDEQAAIHPEYIGHTFFIVFQPPFDVYSQFKFWQGATFLNVAAFPKDLNGKIYIDFEGGGADAEVRIQAALFIGTDIGLQVTPENTPQFLSIPVAFYQFQKHTGNPGTFSGTIVAKVTAPFSITGPDNIGGGGGGGE